MAMRGRFIQADHGWRPAMSGSVLAQGFGAEARLPDALDIHGEIQYAR